MGPQTVGALLLGEVLLVEVLTIPTGRQQAGRVLCVAVAVAAAEEDSQQGTLRWPVSPAV